MTMLQAFNDDLNTTLTLIIRRYLEDTNTSFDVLKNAYINRETPSAVNDAISQLLRQKETEDIEDFRSKLQKSLYEQQKIEDERNQLQDTQEANQDSQSILQLQSEIEGLNTANQTLQMNLERNNISIQALEHRLVQSESTYSQSLSSLNQKKNDFQSSKSGQESILSSIKQDYNRSKRSLDTSIEQINNQIRLKEAEIHTKERQMSSLNSMERLSIPTQNKHTHGHDSSHVHGHFGRVVHGHGAASSESQLNDIRNKKRVLASEIELNRSNLSRLQQDLRTREDERTNARLALERKESEYRMPLTPIQRQLDDVDVSISRLKNSFTQEQQNLKNQKQKLEQSNTDLTDKSAQNSATIKSKRSQIDRKNQAHHERRSQQILRESRSRYFSNYNTTGNWFIEGLSINNQQAFQAGLTTFTKQATDLKHVIEQKIVEIAHSLYKKEIEVAVFLDQDKQQALKIMIDAMRDYEKHTVTVNELKQKINSTKQHLREKYFFEYEQYAKEQRNKYDQAIAELNNSLKSSLGTLFEMHKKELEELDNRYAIESQQAISEYTQRLIQAIESYELKHQATVSANNTTKQACVNDMESLNERLRLLRTEIASNQQTLSRYDQDLEQANNKCAQLDDENRARLAQIGKNNSKLPWLIVGGLASWLLIIPIALTGLGATFLGIPLLAIAVALTVIGLVCWSLLLVFSINNANAQNSITANELSITKYQQELNTIQSPIHAALTSQIKQLTATLTEKTTQLEQIRIKLNKADEILQSIDHNHPRHTAIKGNEALTARYNQSKSQCTAAYTERCTTTKADIEARKTQVKKSYESDLAKAQHAAKHEFNQADTVEIETLQEQLHQYEEWAESALQGAKAADLADSNQRLPDYFTIFAHREKPSAPTPGQESSSPQPPG